MSEPREYTVDEAQDRLLKAIAQKVDYWESLPNKSTRERMNGVVFSILAALDGCSLAVPGFMVIPDPHPDDKNAHRERGENWYPDPALDKDIAGSLHNQWCKVRKDA